MCGVRKPTSPTAHGVAQAVTLGPALCPAYIYFTHGAPGVSKGAALGPALCHMHGCMFTHSAPGLPQGIKLGPTLCHVHVYIHTSPTAPGLSHGVTLGPTLWRRLCFRASTRIHTYLTHSAWGSTRCN